MGISWDHTIRPLDRSEFRFGFCGIQPSCASKNCERPALYETSYDYSTGRAGRVTTRYTRQCVVHATGYAEQHELTLPPDNSPPATARIDGQPRPVFLEKAADKTVALVGEWVVAGIWGISYSNGWHGSKFPTRRSDNDFFADREAAESWLLWTASTMNLPECIEQTGADQ